MPVIFDEAEQKILHVDNRLLYTRSEYNDSLKASTQPCYDKTLAVQHDP